MFWVNLSRFLLFNNFFLVFNTFGKLFSLRFLLWFFFDFRFKTRVYVLAYLKLSLYIRYSNMKITILKLRKFWLRINLVQWYLMMMTAIFKYDLDATQSWIKPFESHSLKCFFCGFINLTLLLFIQNCFLKGRLVDLPNQILIDFSQETVWLYSMVCLFKFFIE